VPARRRNRAALAVALATLGSPGAAAVRAGDCPPPLAGETSTRLEALRSAAGELDRLRAASEPACAPGLELRRGLVLVAAGEPVRAMTPLLAALVADPSEARAWLGLARAQALDNDPYAALTSLASAERLPVESAGDEILAEASHLARLHLRPGGSAWGAYRPEPVLGPIDGDDGDGEALAGDGRRCLVLGRRQVLAIGERGAAPLMVVEERMQALAASPRGWVVALGRDGQVAASDGLRLTLALPGGRFRPSALAVGGDDHLHVLSGGRIHVFSPSGQHLRTLAEPVDAVDLDGDGRGRLHVLGAGAAGIAVLDGTGRVERRIPATGEGWRWQRADAIATDRYGASYVLVRHPGVVYLFDPSGRFLGRIDPPPAEPKLLRSARDLAVGAAGDLHVLVGKGRLASW
jgi:hypothetical protein